jgi:CubicO group peptidase (beta-lactamase class C family)
MTQSRAAGIVVRRLVFALVSVAWCRALSAQTPQPAHRPLRLADYAATYQYRHGRDVQIVAGRDLFAVLDGAKYPLRPVAMDAFLNDGGDTVRFRIAVGDIGASDLSVSIADRIVRGILDGAYPDVHSVLLYQRGHLVMEEYFYGYDAARPHQLRSATKSVVSALAGIAVAQGALSGVRERVLPRLPYRAYAHPDPRKSAITLGDFLTMSSGLDCNDHSATSPGRETVLDETPDWVKATLDLPMINDPGAKAFYCSGGVAVVGRLTELATHMPLPAFAQRYLFGPLGIRRRDWTWDYDLTNADREFSQIHLRPRDMLKLGVLFAGSGRWDGRQVVPAAWVRASLAAHSQVDGTGYGYLWWRPYLNVATQRGIQQVYYDAAQGNGGQKIYLVPQYDLVAVFTAGAYNSRSAPPNRIMADIVLPALMKARAGAGLSARER